MNQTKFRNVIRPGYMRNFSKNIIERYIMIDDALMSYEEQDAFVKKINERLWHLIQEVNAVVEGIVLPFVCVRKVVMYNSKLRVIINDFNCSCHEEDLDEAREIDPSEITHLINFKTLTPQRRVIVQDSLVPSDARMIIDEKDEIAAAIDIFLDIAMFNAHSYLYNMEMVDKKAFSIRKLSFYEEQSAQKRMTSYYDIDENEKPAYFSFAFAARTSTSTFDVYRYVEIWRKFIQSEFANENNINKKPHEQLLQYIDKDNIDTKYLNEEFWETYSKGEYLFLRVNREPNTDEQKERLLMYFRATQFRIGLVKIVPISEYHNPYLTPFLQELYVSAYKIVV